MRYDKDRKIVRNILKTADITNTFNGGMSQPQVDFAKMKDHYLISVKVPGVDLSKLNVEIINQQLVVSHPVNFKMNRSTVDIPHVVANFPITLEIDYQNISASEKEGVLKVILPLNELAGGFRKNVEISR